MNDPNLVDTKELNSCFVEGFSKKSTIEFFDISQEEYDKVFNSKENILTKIGKNSPCYEDFKE